MNKLIKKYPFKCTYGTPSIPVPGIFERYSTRVT